MDQMHKRFAYQIGDHLPKWLRIIYYIVLIGTLIYVLYRLIEWFLITFRKIGAFVFAPQNYWAFVTSAMFLVVGGLIIAQFFLGLNPFGDLASWVSGLYDSVIEWFKHTIQGMLEGLVYVGRN